VTGLSHARPSLHSGLPWDSRAAATDVNVNNTGQLTCYEKRTFSLAIDRADSCGSVALRLPKL